MKKSLITLGLENPKSPSNVDVVMRASGCYGVDAVLYTGTRYKRAAQFNSDRHDSRDNVDLRQVSDLIDARPEGARLVCVELTVGAIALPEYEHPENAYYIFGPEDNTVHQETLNVADDVVYIPTYKCMNLAATANVLLYDRMSKGDLSHANYNLIRKVRNTNNKTTTRGPDPL